MLSPIPGGFSPDKSERLIDFVREFAFVVNQFLQCHGHNYQSMQIYCAEKASRVLKQVAIDVKNAGANYYDEEVVIDPSGMVIKSYTRNRLMHLTKQSLML